MRPKRVEGRVQTAAPGHLNHDLWDQLDLLDAGMSFKPLSFIRFFIMCGKRFLEHRKDCAIVNATCLNPRKYCALWNTGFFGCLWWPLGASWGLQ